MVGRFGTKQDEARRLVLQQKRVLNKEPIQPRSPLRRSSRAPSSDSTACFVQVPRSPLALRVRGTAQKVDRNAPRKPLIKEASSLCTRSRGPSASRAVPLPTLGTHQAVERAARQLKTSSGPQKDQTRR